LVDERGHTRQASEPPRLAPKPHVDDVLALQHGAGNAAVARWLQAKQAVIARAADGEDVTTVADVSSETADQGDPSLSEDEISEQSGEDPLAALTRAAAEHQAATGTVVPTPPPEPTGDQVQQQGEQAEDESETEISEDEPDVIPAETADEGMTEISDGERAVATNGYKNAPTVYQNASTVYQNQDIVKSSKYVPGKPIAYQNVVEEPAVVTAPPRRPGRAKRGLKTIATPFRALGKGIAKLKPKGVSFSSGEASDNRAPKIKYADLAKMDLHYAKEQHGTAAFVNDLLTNALADDMRRFKMAAETEQDSAILSDRARVRNALQKIWGWTAADVAKYYDNKKGRVSGTKVTYLRSAKDLAKYAVTLGSTLMHGAPPKPLDTGTMLSKFSGPGYGIFVMDGAGNLFVGQHKVGLFHHSSFKAGGAVAAAGEMKVASGRLLEVTAKSGHYSPTPEQTSQVLRALADAGVVLAGVDCKVWMPPQKGGDYQIVVFDAEEFLREGRNATQKAVQGL
jgi:hypothetical protein